MNEKNIRQINNTPPCRAFVPNQTEDPGVIRRMTLCKRCENALRFHRQYVSAVSDGAVRTVKSCDVCHTRTFCRTFDVGSLPRQTGAF